MTHELENQRPKSQETTVKKTIPAQVTNALFILNRRLSAPKPRVVPRFSQVIHKPSVRPGTHHLEMEQLLLTLPG